MTGKTDRPSEWTHYARWIAPWLGLLLLAALVIFGGLENAEADLTAQLTATPQAVSITSAGPTPLPAEYFRTRDQSSGIVFGAVVLVLIVLVSALRMLFRKPKK